MLERHHEVRLHGRSIGAIHHKGDVTRFEFEAGYWDREDRAVLGLWFEDHPRESPRSSMTLPSWFSNLLPEGRMRDWIALDRGVSVQREMELLLRVGADLPGAVEVIEDGAAPSPGGDFGQPDMRAERRKTTAPWKFSLAGVGMKFSMLQTGERLTLPASDALGDWIVKMPDAVHKNVPLNEYMVMSLARQVGIDVPPIRLVGRDDLPDIPDTAWPGTEATAYAVSRFDRSSAGRVHMEDLNQVRGFLPDGKYDGAFETLAGLIYRGKDDTSLVECVRRFAFDLLVGNGDSHLKNWSLLYADGRTASISPAYDLVSTAPYSANDDEGLALSFASSKRFGQVSLSGFQRLERKLGAAHLHLVDVVRETASLFEDAWSAYEKDDALAPVTSWISSHLSSRLSQLNP
jgi:serine/threonine-protein kinase HipA